LWKVINDLNQGIRQAPKPFDVAAFRQDVCDTARRDLQGAADMVTKALPDEKTEPKDWQAALFRAQGIE
jgi:hypothetical protein